MPPPLPPTDAAGGASGVQRTAAAAAAEGAELGLAASTVRGMTGPATPPLQAEPLVRKAVAGRKADRAPGQRLALCAACKINTVATQGHFAGPGLLAVCPDPLCAPLCRECFARRGPLAVELVEFDDLKADNRI